MCRCTLLALILGLLLVAASVYAAGDITAELTQIDASDYPNITLYISVRDESGQLMEGLRQQDFQVTEDGAQVEIIDFSAGIRSSIITVLTIDRSGSMDADGKLQGAKTAALTFVDLMRAQDQAAIVVFDSTVEVMQPFTSDKALLHRQIRSLRAGGCTAWYDGIYDSVELIAMHEGRRSIILLSDGVDCSESLVQRLFGSGSKHSLDQAIRQAVDASIPVYTIGLGAQASQVVKDESYDREKLQRVARETGGKFYHAPTAAELEALYRSLSQVMQKEYVITYRSPRPNYDGTRRNIVVTVVGDKTGGATTRGGYLEKHLINIRSDWRLFLLLLAPLLVALAIPPVQNRVTRARRQSSQTDDARPPDRDGPVTPPAAVAASDAVQQSPCARCSKALRPGAKFCGFCGAPAPAPGPSSNDFCPDCGRPARAGARFCGGCGHPFS